MSATGLGIKSILGKILTAGSCDAANRDIGGSGTATVDNVQHIAVDLAFCVVDHYTGGLAGFKSLDHRVPGCWKTLLRMVDHMSERHQILFSSIVTRLKVSCDNIAPTFSNVVNEMFGDNQYNWGRVVTVYAFAGWLARYVCCSKDSEITVTQPSDESNNLHSCAEQIAQLAGDFVAERLGSWIFKQGGWDVMDEFFAHRDDPEGAIWHGLLYTFVGLGALATMAAVR